MGEAPRTVRAAKQPTPTETVLAWWPTGVREAARYGKQWPSRPTKNQLSRIAARVRAGATPADLTAAIHGYVAQNGTETRDKFEPLRYLRATTLYQATKFDDYVAAAAEAKVEQGGTLDARYRAYLRKRQANGATLTAEELAALEGGEDAASC